MVPVQDPLDHAYIPAIVNTQLVTPWVANDVAVKGTFPGINVNDEERANVRPPNPSLCVGDNYVVEVSDMVRAAPAITGSQATGARHGCAARQLSRGCWRGWGLLLPICHAERSLEIACQFDK